MAAMMMITAMIGKTTAYQGNGGGSTTGFMVPAGITRILACTGEGEDIIIST